jgi:cytoskeletal protein CcmA (bactofilin family)
MSEGFDSTQCPMFGSRGTEPLRRAGIYWSIAALAAILALSACGGSGDGNESAKINGSVHIPAGKPPGIAATVNGAIHVDDNAAVTSATTVNGSVHLGDHATAGSLSSVNGAIAIGKGAHVSGSVSSVNGELTLADGADLSGSLSNVNGEISLTAAHVDGGIKTVNANIKITGASRVEGGILMQKPSTGLVQLNQDVPRIVIGPGATVQGELRFERPVQLYVSDKATIGTVTGASPIPFTGENPPN